MGYIGDYLSLNYNPDDSIRIQISKDKYILVSQYIGLITMFTGFKVIE